MPRELDGLYQETLDRVQQQAGDDGVLGMRILSWITNAKRPLVVDELRFGLAVEYSDDPEHLEEFDADNLLPPRSLIDVCAGLVIIDSNSQIVRLVHYTTQEYLDKERMLLFKGINVDISRACLTYLSCNIGTEDQYQGGGRWLFKSHPFLDYACRYWFSHARNVLLAENPDSSFVKVLTRFKSSRSINFSVHLLWGLLYPYSRASWPGIPDTKEQACPYEVASNFGLEDLLDVLLDRRVGPHPNLDSSLVIASIWDQLNMARLLLQHGAAADATMLCGSDETRSALEVACKEGNLAVVELLIEHGADIHGRNTAKNPPIHAAVVYNNLDIINLLLKKGVNVNARNFRGETACHVAVTKTNPESTRRLVDAGCDLELRNNDGDTVLLACRIYTSLQIIELLLDRGADACAKNNEGKTLRNIIEDRLERSHYYRRDRRRNAERIVEMLRQAEQKSSTTATNDPQRSKSTSPPQTVSHTPTS